MRIKYLLLLMIGLVLIMIMSNNDSSALGKCTCDVVDEQHNMRIRRSHDSTGQLLIRYKLIGIGSVLVSGGIGVSIPLMGRKFEALRPENDIFFMIKAFAAGVILATAFIHILPDAFISLTSPCLNHNPWSKFPFAGFVAMMSSILTLMLDSFATTFYNKKKKKKKILDFDDHDHDDHIKPHSQSQSQQEDQEINPDHVETAADHHHHHHHVIHTHAHDQAYNNYIPPPGMAHSDLIRQRIISQVLELGIVIHSVIIGVSLGASESPATIKPLLIALSFHQFFEGMGLGGCISQAKFKSLSTVIMAVFFSITTPVGIVIGIGVSTSYNGNGNGNTETALIVEGIFYSASAGILIYMALVDLLAPDFMNPRIQTNAILQLGANISLLLGAGCMSIMAKWA